MFKNLVTAAIALVCIGCDSKDESCGGISGYHGPGEGDVAALVSFRSAQFEESLATLESFADETVNSGNRSNIGVYKSTFEVPRQLVGVLWLTIKLVGVTDEAHCWATEESLLRCLLDLDLNYTVLKMDDGIHGDARLHEVLFLFGEGNLVGCA